MSVPQREALARRRAALSPRARAALAQRLRGAGEVGFALPANESRDAPLSYTQELFWLRQQAFPEDCATNVFVSVRLRGQLNVAALRESCSELLSRHDVLRSRFVLVDGEPRARVAGPAELPLREADLSAAGAPERALAELARAEAGRAFDLAAEAPVRALLVRLAGDDHVLLLTIHHIATDAWSNGVLLEELAALYRGGRAALPRPAVRFADYARWQREEVGADVRERAESYWRETLSSAPRGIELPADRPRGGAGPRRSARLVTAVPAEDLGALVRFCQSIRVPTFAGLMAVLQVLLHRYSRAEDFLVGVPFSGRTRPELTRVVGPLFTTVPLRAKLSGAPSFRELAVRVRTAAAEAFNHSAVPADRFLAAARGSTPYDVLFALQDASRPAVELPGLTIEHIELGEGTAQCPLTLSAVPEAGGLRMVTDYDRDLFHPDTITQLMGHYGRLLRTLVSTPDSSVGEVPMLTEAERTTVLVDWNRTEAPRPPVPVLPELFHRQVLRTPDAPALRHGDEQLSYVELWRRANECAARLGVGRGDIVGVCMDRSADLVVALLAVLITGAAYLPLDPAHPAERRERALRQSGARLVLTGLDDLPPADPSWRPARVDPRDVAYVIHTSGSTGAPKGVLIAHDGVCDNAAWRREVTGLGPGDRLLHTVSFAFDPSVWQLFGPLLAGAEVILAGADPDRVVELIRRHRVTIADFVPATLTRVLDAARPGDLDSLTHVFCGGERLGRDLADRCLRELKAVLHNQYGPTEATIDTTSAVVGPDGSVGIGRPIANKRVYVLDQNLEPVPVGVAGELWIGGTGLAYGYLGAPADTADRFRPDPFWQPGSRMYRSGDLVRYRRDGGLEFLGRLDDQVKLNGVRIEPAEVAAALRRHPDVADAVVVAREVGGRPALVAYVVPGRGGVDAQALRGHVARALPPAFVPARVVAVPAIPRGVTGKVATEGLPEVGPEPRTVRTVQPGSTEERLIGLWRRVLGRDDIAVDDDFFGTGGDSLLALRLISAVGEDFGVELGLPELFAAPTVAGLAAVIADRLVAEAPAPQTALVRLGSGTAPLSFAQERVYRQALAGAGPDELWLSMVAHLRGELDTEVLGEALAEVVTRHEALRVAIGGTSQNVVPPYRIRLDRAEKLSLVDGRLLDASLDGQVLTLHLHRIAADGVSAQILARDLALTYAALRTGRRPELPALTVQHPDYAHWERATLTTEVVAGAVREWRRDAGDLSWLPAFRSRTTRRVQQSVALDAARIRALARDRQQSPRTVLLTAFAAACARRLEPDNLYACVPVSGRDAPALRPVIGRLVNMAVLPVRSDVDGSVITRAYQAAARLPFLALEDAIEADRDPTRPVFPLLFDVADPPAELPAIAGLDIEVRQPRERWTDFGLALQAHHAGDGLELIALRDPDVFTDDLVTGLLDDIREAV